MTELQITLYSGVPFNNKYKDVLFVSRETRETFLNNYSIGDNFTVNRFEIINDNETVVDITNDYNGFECNYAKVHTKLQPETSNEIYERDTFYFVNSARQIGTNVVRLTLEKDVFQTDFNKYNYSISDYQIPQIKNGRCILTNDEQDDFANIEDKTTLTNLLNSNDTYSATSLWEKSQTFTHVHAVMHFVDPTFGEFVAISKNSFSVYDNSTNVYPYGIDTLLTSIASNDVFYIGTASMQLTVLNLYLIPQELLTNLDTTNMNTGYFKYTMPQGHQNVEYWLTQNSVGIVQTKNHTISKTFNFEEYKKVSVGTYSHQIELENNGKSHTISLQFIFSSNLQVLLVGNNQIIDIAQDFEFSIFKSALAEFLTTHKNSLAIKGVSNALNLLTAGFGAMSGNPTSLLGFGKTITNIAGDFAEFSDLGNQPLKLQVESNSNWNIYNLNGIGVFKWTALNKNEIQKNAKYYGDKVDFLTNLSLYYKTNTYTENSTTYTVNFDYFQFANLELIANLPENTKTTIENMFLQGIRVWYNPTKFLQTIERKEIQV